MSRQGREDRPETREEVDLSTRNTELQAFASQNGAMSCTPTLIPNELTCKCNQNTTPSTLLLTTITITITISSHHSLFPRSPTYSPQTLHSRHDRQQGSPHSLRMSPFPYLLISPFCFLSQPDVPDPDTNMRTVYGQQGPAHLAVVSRRKTGYLGRET